MQIFISIVVTLLVLTALIVVHEFGHYIVAKKCGIKVDAFAIGFGPRLIKWYRNGTEFSIRPIFAGGFVRFADDVEKEPQPGDLRAASLKSRALTIAAGPAMNVILAVVLITILLMSAPSGRPVIQETIDGLPAAEAGILPGDTVTEWNDVRVDFSYDMPQAVAGAQDGVNYITVERDGQKYSYEVPYVQVDGTNLIGITYTYDPLNVFEAIGLSFKWIGVQMREIVTVLGELIFTGQGVENVSGIVGTTQIVGEVATNPAYGYDMMLTLIALISVNLAIINLLPIPVLDGGKLVMYAVEGIRKKPAPERLEGILNLAGFVFLIGLSVFLVIQDVGRLMP